jgi:hypothetical protein
MSVDTQWIATTATVVSSDFHYTRLRDLDFESHCKLDQSFNLIHFRYLVDGLEFFGTIQMYNPMSPGDPLAISYNPDDPAQNSTAPRKIRIRVRLAVWAVGIAMTAAFILLCNHLSLPSD